MQMQHIDACPGLWIGSQFASRDPSKLMEAGITHMLAANGQEPMLRRVLGNFMEVQHILCSM